MVGRLGAWLSAVVLSGAVLLAQGPPASATTVRLRGTIAQYDPATRVLSLATERGTVRLALPASIRIRQGWHKVDAPDLRRLVGVQATVRYTESGTNRTVESVHVFDK
jgi:hypothetical protein